MSAPSGSAKWSSIAYTAARPVPSSVISKALVEFHPPFHAHFPDQVQIAHSRLLTWQFEVDRHHRRTPLDQTLRLHLCVISCNCRAEMEPFISPPAGMILLSPLIWTSRIRLLYCSDTRRLSQKGLSSSSCYRQQRRTGYQLCQLPRTFI
ncbi:hypothetical protein BDR05DRAFT_565462 [Suillus weaverae]|nr:hypothetical protein BDR05DRAFT_565462 [Suillus weaverae]